MPQATVATLIKQRMGFSGAPGKGKPGRARGCALLPVTQGEMLAAISIGQILAVLVTLHLIALSFAAYVIMRRK